MKPYLLFILLIVTSLLRSQPYGNEWINFNQNYYHFPVSQDGVYRISRSDLVNAGIPIASVNPKNIQLFAGGVEIPIYVEGESDGSFDVNDFIEFYGEANNGFADEQLYGSAASHPHPGYSLFNDTIYYYLTWNNSTSNKRYFAENDVNYSSFAASNYVWRKSISTFNFTYYSGETHSGGGTDPAYDETEGWLDYAIGLGGSRVRNVSTPKVFSAGPSAEVHWRLLGESNYSRLSQDHHLNVQFGGITFDTVYGGYRTIDKRFSLSPASLGSNNTSFTFRSINDLGSGADRSAISFIEVKYPHQLNFNGASSFTFYVKDQGGQSKSYLPFSGFTASGPAWIYDLTNQKRIRVTTTGSSHQVLIPNSGNEKKCIAFSQGNVLSITSLKAMNGNGLFTNYANAEIPNGFLIITHKSLLSGANQYASYRNSSGHGALVIDIDELYHQFIYGIKKHPYSIRHFTEYIVDTWTNKPKNLFLLGKSIKAHEHRKNGAYYAGNLVPSFGNPASDILLTAGLNQTILQPLLPTGRISARTNEEVDWYLQKVIEFESNGLKNWMKNILHFAGGTSGTESDRFVSYLKSFGDILEDTSFGGTVLTFKKNTTAPIQISLSDSIRNLINGGTSLLTFFGHASSTGGFDQNIDIPENYNNKGKYPLLVGNACYTGDIHKGQGQSVSEQFVLIKDKGVIGFLSSVDLGFEDKLRDYSRNLFKSMGQVNYGGSIGEHMIYAIERIQLSGTTYPYRSINLLMTLHGDPAIVLNAQPNPDYEITTKQIKTTPEIVTTASDTFELNIQIFNYGKAINDSLRIEVIRFYPDLSSEVISLASPPVKYERNVTLKLPVNAVKGAGFNRFDISLDPSNLISEVNEGNNFVSINIFIKSGDLIPVMPYRFAIVPQQSPVLKASTGYAFESFGEYEFQLDTNDAFIMPLETYKTSGKGGVFSWKPATLSQMKDSAVYFWRTRNSSGSENSIWRISSFQYIKNKRGWSQDHFHQFKSDYKLFLEMNENTRLFEFSPSIKRLTCQTSSTLNFSDLGDILYKLDADLKEYGGCSLSPSIHVAILDSLTFDPWGTPFKGQNGNHYFGQINFNGNCGKPRVQNQFIFQASGASQLAGLKDMLLNKVPVGNYILAWTWVRNDFSKWDNIDPTMRGVFTSLGADTITSISNDSLPYIFFVKKGSPNTAIEVVGANYDEFIYLTADLKNNSTYGSIVSPIIGPSSSWDSLSWNHFSTSNPLTDSLSLKMTGLARDVKTEMAQKKFKKGEKNNNISNLLNHQSAPYMELDLYLNNNTSQVAPQLDRWTVLYNGVMDLALNSNELIDFYSDTLQEGEMLSFRTSVKNISEYDADSVLIKYYIIDKNRNRIDIPYNRQKPLRADSSLITSIEFSSIGLRGNNTLVVEVNPDQDQIEQHRFNNIGQIPFYVRGDNTNPILDVTFDGVHILDGDIVSAKPEITMQLSDENQYLILDDTSDFRVYLTDVNGLEKQYFFQSSNNEYSIEFIPASGGKNKARVEFSPKFPKDGVYALRVQARDRSSNESGKVDYRITFEVINRSTITNLLNYPNPFSTSTQFVFVLTGSVIPDNMQIQIMTISGKIVKTIYMHELGPIRIGRNITNYAWDGRDEYGDKLANGVYLYRVKTRLNGQSIEQRSTSADYYFKQGFGKMVILR